MKFSTAFTSALFVILFTKPSSAQNNSLNFDGINDYIRVPYNASHDVTTAVTIEAWVYPTNNNWGNILIKGNYGYGFALSGKSGGAGTCASTNNLVFWDQSQCGSTVRSALGYTLNSWQHVAVTVQATGPQLAINFYVNGVKDGPYNVTRALDNGNINNEVYIGTQGFGGGNFFTGNMEELRLWTLARTPSEIATAMNSQLNPVGQTGLALYYSFNQGVGGANNSTETIATDGSANANNGTLNNFALNGSTSNWTGISPAVLPVKLLYFDAVPDGKNIQLNWSTAQEQASKNFEVQRSENNNNFNRIGNVDAAGNSNNKVDYHFTDRSPLAGTSFYRLKQIDIDDRFTYSRIVTVNTTSANSLKLQGNPVQDQVKAAFSSETSGAVKVIIADAAGAILTERTITVQKGNNELVIPLPGINAGLYYLQVVSGSWKQVLKFSKL